MRGGLLRRWLAPWPVLAVGACSNIIGISSYEIDPALDPDQGGTSAILQGGAGEAGAPSMEGGGATSLGGGGETTTGGEAGSGGSSSPGGSGTVAGDAGSAGEAPTTGCQNAKDCDDGIDCTVDACSTSGSCTHSPSDTRCDATNCESCQSGIGCVAGPKQSLQLLLDPNFDQDAGDWQENEPGYVVSNAQALSSPKLVKIGPAPANAADYTYGDIYQYVTMPDKLATLSLTLNYRFTPGVKDPANEYVVVALYELSGVEPYTQFHEFYGDDPAQTTWKSATYKASKDEVSGMAGQDFTFDLVAHSFDGVYLFDSFTLDATVCQ